MARYIRYDFKEKFAGDTVKSVSFKDIIYVDSGDPVDLTGVGVRMQIRGSSGNVVKDFTIGEGLVLDAINEVRVLPFKLTKSDTYKYDVQFTFAGDIVETWFVGQIPIIKDITR